MKASVTKSTNNSATPVVRSRPRKPHQNGIGSCGKPRFLQVYLQLMQQREWKQNFLQQQQQEQQLQDELENLHCCQRHESSDDDDGEEFGASRRGVSLESNRRGHVGGGSKSRKHLNRRLAVEYRRASQRMAKLRLPRMPSAYRQNFSPRVRPLRHELQSRLRVSDFKKNPCCLVERLSGSRQKESTGQQQDLRNASNIKKPKSPIVGDDVSNQSGEGPWCFDWHCCGQLESADEWWCIARENRLLEIRGQAVAVRVQQQRIFLARKVRQPDAATADSFDRQLAGCLGGQGGATAAAFSLAPLLQQAEPPTVAAAARQANSSEASGEAPVAAVALVSVGTTVTATTAPAVQTITATPVVGEASGEESPGRRVACRTLSAASGFGGVTNLSSCSRFSCRTPLPSDQTSLLLRGSDAVSMATQSALMPRMVRVSWNEEASMTSSSTSASSDEASNWSP